MILSKHPGTLGECICVPTPHYQAKHLQNATDLPIDLYAHIYETTANPQQRHPLMRRETLDLNFLIPAHPHHLR
jgi:hypothetical protein